MDLAFWGFSRWPFQRQSIANSEAIGASYDEAKARLLYLVDECRGCGLLIGPGGTGKSRLFREVKKYAERRGRSCFEVSGPDLAPGELALQIAGPSPFHADQSIGAAWEAIQRQFASVALVGQPIVVLVDHVDLTSRSVEHDLRRLMAVADHVGASLTVLIAAAEFPSGGRFAEMVDLLIELNSWSPDDVARFVNSSLMNAGARNDVFSPEAIRAIADFTEGIPREVIRLCDLSLLAAMSDDRSDVDGRIVEAAATELSPRRMTGIGVRRNPRQSVLSTEY